MTAPVSDLSDLYDHEIVKLAPIVQELNQRFSAMSNTPKNLAELTNWAQDAFLKIGLIVRVKTAGCLIYDPFRRTYGGPDIEILGRVPGAIEATEGFDHERKMYEVRDSKVKGENYRGQKEKAR